MAENTFKSPGFFEQEIELTAQKEQPTGTPAGIIGASQMGPAFVPMTLGTFNDFEIDSELLHRKNTVHTQFVNG